MTQTQQAGLGGPDRVGAPRQAWAGDLALFAGFMMALIGLFHAVVGLAAILERDFYVVTANYAFSYDIVAWGWAHLAIGLVVAVTGFALLAGSSWARMAGMIIVGLSALGNFLFLPYQPVWSLLIIAVDVLVLWALAVHRPDPSTGRLERSGT